MLSNALKFIKFKRLICDMIIDLSLFRLPRNIQYIEAKKIKNGYLELDHIKCDYIENCTGYVKKIECISCCLTIKHNILHVYFRKSYMMSQFIDAEILILENFIDHQFPHTLHFGGIEFIQFKNCDDHFRNNINIGNIPFEILN